METTIELEPVKKKGYFLGQCYIILTMVGASFAAVGGLIGVGRAAFGGTELTASALAMSYGIFRLFVGRALWLRKRWALYALYLLLGVGFMASLLALPWGLFASAIVALWFAYFYRRRSWFR